MEIVVFWSDNGAVTRSTRSEYDMKPHRDCLAYANCEHYLYAVFLLLLICSWVNESMKK